VLSVVFVRYAIVIAKVRRSQQFIIVYITESLAIFDLSGQTGMLSLLCIKESVQMYMYIKHLHEYVDESVRTYPVVHVGVQLTTAASTSRCLSLHWCSRASVLFRCTYLVLPTSTKPLHRPLLPCIWVVGLLRPF